MEQFFPQHLGIVTQSMPPPPHPPERHTSLMLSAHLSANLFVCPSICSSTQFTVSRIPEILSAQIQPYFTTFVSNQVLVDVALISRS